METQSPTDSFVKQFAPLSPSVVTVVTTITKDDVALGSEFIVSPTEVVTDYHVVKDATEIEIITPSHVTISNVDIESISEEMDLAVLKLPRVLRM